MLLHELVQTSGAVASTRARSEKIERLAGLLRRVPPEEIEVAAAFLSGLLRQGRIGLGPASVRDAVSGETAAEPSLTLVEVDRTFGRIAQVLGRGSAAERARLLGQLFRRTTREEAEFLVRLILGELRQGALEGLLVEALARAAELPAADVRRALMLAGDLQAVARAALVLGAGRGSPRSGSSCSALCSRCWPSLPTISTRRSSAWAWPRSSTSSTARACRCTGRATRCARTRAA